MEIKHQFSGKTGKFYIQKEGIVGAEMNYFKVDENTINIHHTEVKEQFRGIGLGFLLLEAAVKYARENNLKIIPTCSYAEKLIQKNENFHDILN
ncbi:MAG: N-acetyltransferase [Bacteroidetes bacterium]|nr:MAG: N-acetyltransferase [Bacteroidota bacterium]MBL1144572.1 N-acetyltransferase [Bacteroidota bacterium]MCB0803377.1 N-acetyltransferase [Flavobacteriales bacterium]NOG57367.1 N-acetyltransferase [Bacteroidota bacterium]